MPAASHVINVKLMKENYLLWLTQSFPIGEVRVSSDVDGSILAPNQTMMVAPSEETGSRRTIANPGYTSWYHQD